MSKTYVAGLASGFLGGIMGAFVLGHFGAGLGISPASAAPVQDVISASRIRMLDASGRTRAELAMAPDGAPALFFYDTRGRNRLVLGVYSPAENEYPFVVLNDTHNEAAGIFRLFGGQETPVVVLKNKGADRSILGLNPTSTDPFLVNYSSDHKKTAVFGSF
jgi:hypothetical protein